MHKPSLLYYGDTPNAITGFGNVARHVLGRALALNRYNITVFGVNEYFNNPAPLPVRTIPALPNGENDPFGRKKFVDFLFNSDNQFDIWFLQNDIHSWSWLPEVLSILRSKGRGPSKVFTYTVVDAPLRREDVWFLNYVDYAGVPSRYGVQEILKIDPSLAYKVRHIPHGIDTTEFFPLPAEMVSQFKQKVMGCGPNDFLIVNVNRNQVRKAIDRTLMFYGHLRKMVPQARLYLHMEKNEEQYKGWDLLRVVDTNGSRNTGFLSDVSFPENFTSNQGTNMRVLNAVYNCADLVISTTLGEGFGLTTIEAMAAGRLVMMPDNSSLSELIADGRGIPIPCGTSVDDWTILPSDTGHPRPLCSISSMLSLTKDLFQNPSKYEQIRLNGYNWVTSVLPWESVVNLFIHGFENVLPINSIEGKVQV